MLSDAKVATPATAATDAVPPSVPPPGLLPIARVTLPANPVATLPNVSHAVTSTAGVMVRRRGARRLHGEHQSRRRGGVATQLVFGTQPSTTVANRQITPALKSRAAIARAGVEGWAMARSQRDLEGRFCAPYPLETWHPSRGAMSKVWQHAHSRGVI